MNLDRNLDLNSSHFQKVGFARQSTMITTKQQSASFKDQEAESRRSEDQRFFSDSSSDSEIPHDEGIPRSIWPTAPTKKSFKFLNSCRNKNRVIFNARLKSRLQYTQPSQAEPQPLLIEASFNFDQDQTQPLALEGRTNELKTERTENFLNFGPASVNRMDSPGEFEYSSSPVGLALNSQNRFSTSNGFEYRTEGIEAKKITFSPLPNLLRRVKTDRRKDMERPFQLKLESSERIPFLVFKSQQQKHSNTPGKPKSILSTCSLHQSDHREINPETQRKKQVRFSSKCTVLVYNKV